MAASPDNPLSANVVVRPGRLAEVMVGLAAGLGMFLAALDIALNVALPSIRSDFASDYQTVQWIIVVFIATRAGLVLTAGSLADRLGLRRVYLFGGVTYLASMVCIALSPNLGVLVGFRVLQALGTGCLYAVSPAIAASLFPESRRGLGMGLTSASQATGMLAGTLGAGLLVRWFDWEAVFLGRIPFHGRGLSAGGVVDGAGPTGVGRAGWQAVLRLGRRGDPVRGVDLLGHRAALGAVHWVAVAGAAGVAAAGAAAAGGLLVDGGAGPLGAILPRELLRIRGFLVSGGATFLAHLGVFVIWFIFPFYVEDSLGRGPAALGAMLAVMAGLNIGFSIMGGWLCDRTGPKAVGVTGLSRAGGGAVRHGVPGRPVDGGAGCGQHRLGGRRDGVVPVVGLLLDDGQRTSRAVRNGGGGAVAGPSLRHGAVGVGHRRPVRPQKRLPLGRLVRRWADGGGDGGAGVHPGLPGRLLAGGGDSCDGGVYLPFGGAATGLSESGFTGLKD